MANIRTLDMQFLDDLFEMNSGYVLDFVDRTMLSFFAEELNVDIVDNAEGRFFSFLGRMQGAPGASPAEAPKLAFDRPKLLALKQRLKDMWGMDPHQRGYAFEQWLGEAFNLYGLAAREPFRNRGEQIDGSFTLQGETYLLEAKWQSALTPAADLHALEGKLAQKAAWARGLFVSYTGFTEDGLHAFGQGKRVICMDGEDFHDALERELPLDHVLARKARAAAETGLPYQRVRDLFAT